MNNEEPLVIPGVQSWIRVNPQNPDDIENALAMVPDEDRISVAMLLDQHQQFGDARLVVFVRDEKSHILSEVSFEAMYLNPEIGIDEDAPVENGEISLFELGSDGERTTLAQWATRIIPGVDLPSLQEKVRPGNLVLHRPGAIGFEVFGQVDYASLERSNMRLAMLDLALRSDDKRAVLAIAKEYEEWVLQ